MIVALLPIPFFTTRPYSISLALHKNSIDILDSARKVDIREHFRRYSLSVGNQVKSIVLSRKNDPALSKVMRTSLRTLYKHLDEIHHTLSSSFSNGPLDGINNKIKNIKRTGYGFRNFDSLKTRIVLVCNIRTA